MTEKEPIHNQDTLNPEQPINFNNYEPNPSNQQDDILPKPESKVLRLNSETTVQTTPEPQNMNPKDHSLANPFYPTPITDSHQYDGPMEEVQEILNVMPESLPNKLADISTEIHIENQQTSYLDSVAQEETGGNSKNLDLGDDILALAYSTIRSRER